MSRLIYDLAGCRGRHIQVFDDKVIISVNVGIGSVITGNFTDGEKTIYYADCIGVQFKKSGVTIGYLQFETASKLMNHSNSNFFNENTFTWETTQQSNEKMEEVSQYVKERVGSYKSGQYVQSQPQVAINSNATTESLLKRAQLLLEDKEWASANAYCENVLDREPENYAAYLYKLMAELRVGHYEELRDQPQPFDSNTNYQKVMRFADEDLKQTLQSYIVHIKNRNENKRLEDLYRDACAHMASASSIGAYETAALLFNSYLDYKDSADFRKKCFTRIAKIKAENSKQKKKQQMAILLAIPVVLALIFGAYRLKVHMDEPAKQALASALVGTSWQNYFTALDGKYEDTVTMTFVDAETIMETHKVKDNGKSKTSEYTNSWHLKAVSSDSARMVTERTSGTLASTGEYTIVFQNKDGNYQISKIVYGTDPDDTDLVYRRR